MDYELCKRAIEKLKRAKEYVKIAHDNAECKHDSFGELYMDETQYEIMQSTETLLSEITKIINEFENM